METETNEERLEQIGQYRSNFLLLVAAGILNKKIITDFDWLFEQAERAQELASENFEIRKGYQERSKRVQELETKVDHLQEALWDIINCSDIETAVQEIARQALAGETNG